MSSSACTSNRSKALQHPRLITHPSLWDAANFLGPLPPPRSANWRHMWPCRHTLHPPCLPAPSFIRPTASPSPTRTHRAVALLRGRGLAWEEDELGAVLLEALHVGLQGLGGFVPPPRVYRDADGPRQLLMDAGHLRRHARLEPRWPARCPGPGERLGSQMEKGSSALSSQRCSDSGDGHHAEPPAPPRAPAHSPAAPPG